MEYADAMKKSTIPAVCALLLAGCANTVSLRVDTDPPGATIYAGGQNFGRAPVTLEYTPTKERLAAGSLNTSPITAVWVSGAKYSQVVALPTRSGDQQIIFRRPRDVPGYDKDATYGLQLEQLSLMRQQKGSQDLTNAILMPPMFK